MSPTLSIQMDQEDIERLTAFLEGVKDRLDGPSARDRLLPVLLKHLEPLVDSEQSFLAPHSKSDALLISLSARSGRGDRPDTISAFSAPTASNALLQKTWGLLGRSQQKGWAARLKPNRGRRRVFYGPIVHQGHRIVKRNAAGELYDTGKVTQPVPFASQAVEAIGDEEAEAAAQDILRVIWGEEP